LGPAAREAEAAAVEAGLGEGAITNGGASSTGTLSKDGAGASGDGPCVDRTTTSTRAWPASAKAPASKRRRNVRAF
jgi:hypothetical protein